MSKTDLGQDEIQQINHSDVFFLRSSSSSSSRSSSSTGSERKGPAPRIYSDTEDDSELDEAEVRVYCSFIQAGGLYESLNVFKMYDLLNRTRNDLTGKVWGKLKRVRFLSIF